MDLQSKMVSFSQFLLYAGAINTVWSSVPLVWDSLNARTIEPQKTKQQKTFRTVWSKNPRKLTPNTKMTHNILALMFYDYVQDLIAKRLPQVFVSGGRGKSKKNVIRLMMWQRFTSDVRSQVMCYSSSVRSQIMCFFPSDVRRSIDDVVYVRRRIALRVR